jgi:hypothetical protein
MRQTLVLNQVSSSAPFSNHRKKKGGAKSAPPFVISWNIDGLNYLPDVIGWTVVILAGSAK